ncbi:DUF6492 family protein [Methylobacterium sp. Leaf100]|uniref:DUF6492 family protein n=1 Tax=Methylobacterium sp. Leaf100 TaxID=1736252 RepID=UPI0007012CB2|nr:DUF6492 family protein [Methylobacterium sp. Leaf100]KQP34987.1 hypothetical protein ASF25_14060 [Methylobacterium sp. Leaf100]
MRDQGEVAIPGRPESVGLITISHRGDLDRCTVLFDSIDRHMPRRGRHYVIVDDEDLQLFAPCARADRQILPKSQFMPSWLRPIFGLRWRGRRYWWSLHGRPVSGWHVQQFVKIEAARSLPEARFCIIDSDVCFFKDFDLGRIAHPNPTPFHVHAGGVTENRPRHKLWVATAARLLATPVPALPADDYIDQIIVWDQATVRDMTARIETVSRRDWVAAMCRDRDFSEYMIYGAFVAASAIAGSRHAVTHESFTRTHWEADELSLPDILAMLRTSTPRERAFCIQSFGSTPVATIRAALSTFYAEATEKQNDIKHNSVEV